MLYSLNHVWLLAKFLPMIARVVIFNHSMASIMVPFVATTSHWNFPLCCEHLTLQIPIYCYLFFHRSSSVASFSVVRPKSSSFLEKICLSFPRANRPPTITCGSSRASLRYSTASALWWPYFENRGIFSLSPLFLITHLLLPSTNFPQVWNWCVLMLWVL